MPSEREQRPTGRFPNPTGLGGEAPSARGGAPRNGWWGPTEAWRCRQSGCALPELLGGGAVRGHGEPLRAAGDADGVIGVEVRPCPSRKVRNTGEESLVLIPAGVAGLMCRER
jgi:hypothetical protein